MNFKFFLNIFVSSFSFHFEDHWTFSSISIEIISKPIISDIHLGKTTDFFPFTYVIIMMWAVLKHFILVAIHKYI